MKRLKERWDQEFPGDSFLTAQNLRDNAARIKTLDNIMELRRVRVRDEIHDLNGERNGVAGESENGGNGGIVEEEQEELEDLNSERVRFTDEVEMWRNRNIVEEQQDELEDLNCERARLTDKSEIGRNRSIVEEQQDDLDDLNGERARLTDESEMSRNRNIVEDEQVNTDIVLSADEAEIERNFLQELDKLPNIDRLVEKGRERLSKVIISEELVGNCNNVLEKYLTNRESIEDMVDAVYAMGKVVMERMGVKRRTMEPKKNKINRRERKKLDKIKELRQWMARIANEIHRRDKNKRATEKEKKLMKQLKTICGVENFRKEDLLRKKEEMMDEMRYHQATLRKIQEKGKKIKDNTMFLKKEGEFYRKIREKDQEEGETPNIDKFSEFWGNIWEDDSTTPYRPWMQDMGRELYEKVENVKDFVVTSEILSKVIKKRKNWTAPGADGIQNYWWKKFHKVWPCLVKALRKITEDPNSTPEWFPIGRTVLLPKTGRRDLVSEYRPITCLNTVYKIYTGIIAKYMKDHAIENNIWDEGQLGTMEGTLGTVDQLLVDECIMQQVRQHKRNLAVAYYDYKKAYDMVHHDWMLRVYRWMGIPQKVCQVIGKLMRLWKTKLEVYRNGEKKISRWITIKKGFLQGDSYSPVGFCLTEVPIGELLKKSRGYAMTRGEDSEVRRTHSLFIDDLKIYASGHEQLKVMNETIVLASEDTGAMYGVKKCAEIVYRRGKMVKGEGLDILEERMQALDPETNDFYKFLGCEQTNGIDVKRVLERVKLEMKKRMDRILNSSLSEKNLLKGINCYVLPIATYVMNVCKISKTDLTELDMIVKRKLRKKYIHGRICSDERLYMAKEVGGRGLRSLREAYINTKTRIACYLALSGNYWMKQVWRYELEKKHWSVKKEVEEAWRSIGEELEIRQDTIILNGERIEGDWKKVKKVLKSRFTDRVELRRKYALEAKEMQGKGYKNLDENSHHWLNCNVEPRKVGAIIEMQERMIETRAWKKARNIDVESEMCRLCGKFKESVDHLLSGCEKLAGTEYMKRHNNALMVMATVWGIGKGLLDEKTKWYQLTWPKGTVLENENGKIIWDFEFKTRKKTRARRPDLILEDRKNKKIFIVDMACPMEENIEEKRREKLTKYGQLAFEMRERRRGYEVTIVPLVIGCLGGGGNNALKELEKLVLKRPKEVLGEMIKVVLWEGESMVRKVMSGLIQE